MGLVNDFFEIMSCANTLVSNGMPVGLSWELCYYAQNMRIQSFVEQAQNMLAMYS